MPRFKTICWAAKEFAYEFIVLIILLSAGLVLYIVKLFKRKPKEKQIPIEEFENIMYHQTTTK